MLQPAGHHSLNQGTSWTPMHVMGAIMLAAGVAANGWLLGSVGGGYGWRLGALLLSPGLILLITSWLIEKTPSSRGCLTFAALLMVALSAFWGIMGIYMVRLHTPVTDRDAYERIMDEAGYPDTRYLAHFPPRIPDAATQIEFYHLPSVMGGAAIYELRLTLPEEQIGEIIRRARLSETLEPLREPPEEIPHGGPGREWIAAAPEQYMADERINEEGPVWGIAIDPDTGEVIYWADNWRKT